VLRLYFLASAYMGEWTIFLELPTDSAQLVYSLGYRM